MISRRLQQQVKERDGGQCRGEYVCISGHEVKRVGNCGRRGTVACHIKHAGMGGCRSDHRLENLLWLCQVHHDYMDERISKRECERLKYGG